MKKIYYQIKIALELAHRKSVFNIHVYKKRENMKSQNFFYVIVRSFPLFSFYESGNLECAPFDLNVSFKLSDFFW